MGHCLPIIYHRLANVLLVQITLRLSLRTATYFLFSNVIQFSILAFILIVHISFRRFIARSLYLNIQRVVKKSSLVELFFTFQTVTTKTTDKVKPTYVTMRRRISWRVYSEEASIYREEGGCL